MAQPHELDQYHAEVVAMKERCEQGARKEMSQYEYPCFVARAVRERWRLKYEHGLAVLNLIYGVGE